MTDEILYDQWYPVAMKNKLTDPNTKVDLWVRWYSNITRKWIAWREYDIKIGDVIDGHEAKEFKDGPHYLSVPLDQYAIKSLRSDKSKVMAIELNQVQPTHFRLVPMPPDGTGDDHAN